jgi:hypothetical protein
MASPVIAAGLHTEGKLPSMIGSGPLRWIVSLTEGQEVTLLGFIRYSAFRASRSRRLDHIDSRPRRYGRNECGC